MNYKEQLEAELLDVINDLKRIKFMHSNADAINQKRMAYESRMDAILRALELLSKQDIASSKKKKGGVKIE